MAFLFYGLFLPAAKWPLRVVSGPSALYHPNVRFRGQSGRSSIAKTTQMRVCFRPQADIHYVALRPSVILKPQGPA